MRKWKAHALQRFMAAMPAGGRVTNVGSTEEKSVRAIAGLVLGCPLCADNGHASGRGGVTASGARVGGS